MTWFGAGALLAAAGSCAVLAGTGVAAVRTHAPACNRSATLPLEGSAASASAVLAPVLGGSFNVCAAAPSAAVRAKLAAIRTLYRTNRPLAHKRLLALLAAVRAHPTRVVARSTASTGCTGLDQKINAGAGGIPGVGDLLAAAREAQAVGDGSGAEAAVAAVGATYAAWGGHAGAATVGDWFAIAEGAAALGDDAYAETALANARAAGIDLKVTLSPAYVGGSGDGSIPELTCLGRLDSVLALFNPVVSCTNMPSGSVMSGIAGRSEAGPQPAAGLPGTTGANSDLDCAYVDAEISQSQGASYAGAEISFDYELPLPIQLYSIANFNGGVWSPVSGVGTAAWGFQWDDNGSVVSALTVWVHDTAIYIDGFGPLAAYETIANGLIKSLKLG